MVRLRFFIATNGCDRPQTKFAKVMFLQVSVCPHEGGACMAAPVGGGGVHGCSCGACAWLLRGGACVAATGGHAWLLWGAHAWLPLGAHVWLLWGGMCMVAAGGVLGCCWGCAWLLPGGHAWDTMRYDQ